MDVLVRWKLSDREMERMTREFTVDDHKYWAKDEDDEKQSEMNQRWQDISRENADRYGNFFERSSIKYRAFSGSGPGREPTAI